MKSELVSILLPVYNGGLYLAEALDSILTQTYRNFELIIINDGSTDHSKELLSKYCKLDDRIKVSTHSKNQGIVSSLNEGLKKCHGKYIFRMDADDIMLPLRLDKQINYMDAHPNCVACGTWIKVLTKQNYVWSPPTSDEDIKTALFFECVIAHPSACIRKEVLEKNQIFYNQEYIYVEDYYLWINLSKFGELANIPEVLLFYRSHLGQLSAVKSEIQSKQVEKIKAKLIRAIYHEVTKKEIEFHAKAMAWPIIATTGELNEYRNWYQILVRKNSEKGQYSKKIFNSKIAAKWVGVCHLAKPLGIVRYLYILTIPTLIFASITVLISMKVYSIKQYIKATACRFKLN